MGNTKRVLSYLIFLGLISGTALAVWQHRSILDWWQLRGYVPAAEIAALAADTAMTDPARRVFYVNHPDLMDDSTAFRQACPLNEETIILGCYHSGQRGIFIFDVDSTELDGVEEVTAAHEMLHAAYDRLSSKQRERVDKILTDYFNNNLTDQRIINTINAYKKTEPNDIVNEMHSIFGTEIDHLPPVLEDYYKQYFSDRRAVVAFANAYEAEFTSREAKVKSYEIELSRLKAQIQAQETSLQIQLNNINTDRRRLDSLRDSGQTEEYNSGIDSFNSNVRAYNAAVAKLRSDIASYNSLVEEYNSIARELASLQEAIDTRFTSQTTQ